VRGVPFEREWRVWVDEDDLAPLLTPPFVLHPTRPHVRMDVTLLVGTTIRGRVQTPAGHAIADAELACIPRYSALLSPMHRAKTARKTRSDRNGFFALVGLPAGDYQIMGFKKGYRVVFKGKPVYPDGRSDLGGVRVVLEPAMGEGDHVIYGRVTNKEGQPVADAHVGLAAIGVATLSFGGTEMQTADDGSFRFEGLGKGSFMLAVNKEGYRKHLAEDIAVDTRTDVTLLPEASIRGVVRFPTGTKPGSSFTVRVLRSVPHADQDAPSLASALGSMGRARSFSHAQGEFSLDDIPPGTVLLEASASGFAPGRLEVRVGDGEAVEGVVIRLPPEGAKIHGRVVDFAGAPVAGATVRAVEAGQGTGGLLSLLERQRDHPQTRTNDEGEFELKKLASAVYRVVIEHREFAPATLPAIQADAGQPAARADAILRGGGIVEGTSKPGVMITVAGEGFSSLAATSETGAFRVTRVPAGEYLVRAVITSEDDPTQAPEIYRRRVVVREAKTTRLSLAEEPEGSTVTGRLQPAPKAGSLGMALLMQPGSPAPDPNQLIWQGQIGVGDGQTSRYVVAEALLDAKGAYTLNNVPPGRYVLHIYVNSVMRSLTGSQARLERREGIKVD
jgi:hypothetical protein